ncbi:MAG: TIM-barrel domain-containing protein, partial [Prevotella sp.]
MGYRQLIFSAAILSATAFAHAGNYTKSGNNVTINMTSPYDNGARTVRLQVVSDKIIRVEATPETSFPDKKSLIIVPQQRKTRFSVTQQGDMVTVSTGSIEAVVDSRSGHITFNDASGNVLLRETASAGKTFTSFTVPERETGAGTLTDEQRHGLTWHTQFDSPDDEAFYGLGQHQSEELNMKGLNEDLFQYNTKVSVPMVLSTRGYGLLWDSYSYCRFGNPNAYMQLHRLFRLYDSDGREGALTGTYTDKNGRVLVRREDSLYFEHAVPEKNPLHDTDLGIDALPKGFNLDGAHVIYEGFIEAPQDCDYHFLLYYAGYMSVSVDGNEVVKERWRTAWNPNAWKFRCRLQSHRRIPIRIEWRPDGGVSYCGLRVATPQTAEEQGRLSIWSEMSRYMDYYFIAGKTMDDIVSGYRSLTGRAPVYPKWVLGYWQSRERYKTAAEVEKTLAEFRRRHIPIDNIVQDWNYWKTDSWGDHRFEKERYPDPKAMLDSVHAMNGRFMISVWPKFYDTVDNYKELDNKGLIYKQAIKDDIHDWLGYRGSFYDAYDEEARRIFWRQMDERLYSGLGRAIDAWWMDASEPNVRDCTPMWYRKALCGPTALGSSTEYFNAYSIVNADAVYNGQRSVEPDKRVFLLTRSGFAGEQRYSTATWSGDIGTRWEDMRAQMTAGMNYSIS